VLREAIVAFDEISKQLGMRKAVLILSRTFIRYMKNRGVEDEIERQFLPLIYIHRDILREEGMDRAISISGRIIVRCGSIDISKNIPKLKRNDGLKDYIEKLRRSKYFKHSEYHIVEQRKNFVKIIVKNCVYCNLFKRYGIEYLSPYLCMSDKEFFSKYHPKLKFILNKSIANGDEYCEEVYKWED